MLHRPGRSPGASDPAAHGIASGRQQAEFLINQGQESAHSPCVPPFDGIQDACYITHAESPAFPVSDGLIFERTKGDFKSEASMASTTRVLDCFGLPS